GRTPYVLASPQASGAAIGSTAGFERDENGNLRYNAAKGLAGAAGGFAIASKLNNRFNKPAPQMINGDGVKSAANRAAFNAKEQGASVYKAGYDGYSMSNNARAAYAEGKKPLSKWTRQEILTQAERELKNNPDTDLTLDYLKTLDLDALKHATLRETEWHHTSKFYNETSFYDVDLSSMTKKDIEAYIRNRPAKPLVKSAKEANDILAANGIKPRVVGFWDSNGGRFYFGGNRKALASEIKRNPLFLPEKILEDAKIRVEGLTERVSKGESGLAERLAQVRRDRANAAKDLLIARKEGEVSAALHHKDVGDIDLVWGKAGTGKSDGFGLSKIVEFHPEVLDDLQGLLNMMNVKERGANRIVLESPTHKAVVALVKSGGSKEKQTWLLTEYEKRESLLSRTSDRAKAPLKEEGGSTPPPKASNATIPKTTAKVKEGKTLKSYAPYVAPPIAALFGLDDDLGDNSRPISLDLATSRKIRSSAARQ
ncbi:MAG: hypothetical protein LBO72_01395, partial [Helicobacteraceae bacterium]|nr:hypothetical protein [Helicobacteraceae bacterium]